MAKSSAQSGQLEESQLVKVHTYEQGKNYVPLQEMDKSI